MTKVFKLITGEDAVASVESETPESYSFKYAHRIAFTPDGIGIMPLCPVMKDDQIITINKSHIVFMGDPETKFENEFNSKFGAGIVKPILKIVT